MGLTGGFEDGVGYDASMIQTGMWEGIQTFSVQFQGATYQLSTQFQVFNSTGGGYVFSTSSKKSP
jgi:hypothetical protein